MSGKPEETGGEEQMFAQNENTLRVLEIEGLDSQQKT